MLSKKWIIIIVIVVALSALGIFSFISNKDTAMVELVNPQNVTIIKSVSASGEVKSNKEASLTFVASGKITLMNAQNGNQVKKGQLLAAINTAAQSQTTQSAKDYRDTIIREKDIYIDTYSDDIDGVGGRERFDLEIRKYDERISQAESSYKAQLNLLPNYYIYAPFEATIVDVSKKLGETATAGETIIKLADLNDIYFEVKLDQEDFGEIKLDQKVNVTLDSYGDKVFSAKVYEIPQFTEAGITGGSFVVKISFNDADAQNILLGMSGDSEIITDQSPTEVQALVFDEIYTEDNKPFVWAIDNQNKLEKVQVETGLEGDIYTEIKTDLKDKKIIISTDKKQILKVGQKAKIVSQ